MNCGVFLGVFLAAFGLHSLLPRNTVLTCALVVLPYLFILGFILLRRQHHRPAFCLGDPGTALSRSPLGWCIHAALSTFFAYRNGLLQPLSLVGQWNQVGTVLEGPLVEEFVFRAALLTSLNKTRLRAMTVLHVQGSTILGAVAFSLMHCLLFLTLGFPQQTRCSRFSLH